jgi:hypothetical protein
METRALMPFSNSLVRRVFGFDSSVPTSQGNSVTTSQCALWIDGSHNATFQLCDTRLNTGPGCFGFRNVANIDHSLSVGAFQRLHPIGRITTGLFYSESDVTISDSAIFGEQRDFLKVSL